MLNPKIHWLYWGSMFLLCLPFSDPVIAQEGPSNEDSQNYRSQHYRIHIGDVLQVSVSKHPELSRKISVLGEGNYVLPMEGESNPRAAAIDNTLWELQVVGLTVANTAAALREKLKPMIGTAQVTITVVDTIMKPGPSSETEIGPGKGLGMSIGHDDTASGPVKAMRFNVTFSNLTNEDLTFIPGTIVFCGVTPSKTSLVKLNLTDEHGKQHRHLPYLGDGPPYQGGCAGWTELYVVVLHGGESVSLPLDIAKYVDLSDSKQYVGARFPAGNYSLQAELAAEPSETPPNLRTKPVWTGRIASNSVPVQFASEFLAPVDDYPR